MDIHNTLDVVRALRERLAPVEGAEGLVDALEGEQPQARIAAVLLPLFAHEGETFLAFIRRSTAMRAHSGEIAFPGGRVETGDSSLAQTALREAHEEIGLAPERVEILGVLPPVFTVVSNYLITPVIGYLPHGPGPLQIQKSEVAELLLLPLHKLADPALFHTEEWSNAVMTRTVYFYDYGPYRIWGATGRILHILLNLLLTK